MGKVEHAQRSVAMALHQPLDPLRPILDRTDFLGSLDTTSAYLRAGLVSKGGGGGQACKVRDLRCDDLVFVFVPAAFHRANRHHLDLGPHASHERHHAPVAAHRHTLRRRLLRAGAQWLRWRVLSLEYPLPHRQRLPTGGRGMHHHSERPLQMLRGPPKRQFAAHAHQGLLCVRQQRSIRDLQFFIQGEKTRPHTAGRSHRCVPLRPAAPRAFATSVSLVRGLAAAVHTAHTPVPGWLHSRRRHWLGLLVRSSALADDASAHRPRVQSRPASRADGSLSTVPRRQRCPLLVRSNALVSLRAASWSSLFLTLGTTPFLFVSLPSLGSSPPPLSSKQAAQKNAPHPLANSGQSHLIFGTGSTGSVTTNLLSKLCSAIALYTPIENLDASAPGELAHPIRDAWTGRGDIHRHMTRGNQQNTCHMAN